MTASANPPNRGGTPLASSDALATPTVVDPRAPSAGPAPAKDPDREAVTVVARAGNPARGERAVHAASDGDDDARTMRWEPGATPPAPGSAAGAARAPSEPLRVVSMKTPAPTNAPRPEPVRELPAVQLRALSDLRRTPPVGLGRLAPPRDPAEVRSRRLRDLVTWGSVVVIVACGVTLLIWFVAR